MAIRHFALLVWGAAVLAGCGPSAGPTNNAPPTTSEPEHQASKPQVSVLLGQDNYKKAEPRLAVGKKLKFRGELLGADNPQAVVRVHVAELYAGDEAAVQAAQLTQDYRTDWASAKEKYKSKNIPYDLTIIEGVVAELQPQNFTVILAGDDGKEPARPVDPPAPASTSLPSTPASPAGLALGDEDLSKVKPDFKMKCQEWAGEVNEAKDREKYKGKVVEIAGVVYALHHSDTTPYDTVVSINDPDSNIGIGPDAVIKGKDAWKMVLPGQTVTLRGRYSPSHFRDLRGAQIIAVSGKPYSSVTVEELVNAAKKVDEANEKYGESRRSFLLTGKVLSIRNDTFSASPGRVEFVMTPSGNSPPLVVGVASSPMERFFSQVKEGQTIKVLGRLQAKKEETRFFAYAILEANC